MKHLTIMISLAALTILFAAAAQAQDFGPGQGNGVCQFIDEDGDGFNDLAPDAESYLALHKMATFEYTARKPISLRTFSSTRRPQQNQSHRLFPFNFAFLISPS